MTYTPPTAATALGTLTVTKYNNEVKGNIEHLYNAGTATQGSVVSRTGNLTSSYLRTPIINGTTTAINDLQNTVDDNSFYILQSNSSGGTITYKLAYTNNAGTSYTFPTATGLPKGLDIQGKIACSSNGSVIYIAGLGTSFVPSHIHVSTNSGETFTATSSGTAFWGNYRPVCSSSGSTVYSIKDGTALNYSNNTGATWSTATLAGTSFVSVACSSSGSIAYMVSSGTTTYSGGTVYKTTNSGATWSTVTAAGNRRWLDVSCSSDGSAVILASINGTAEALSYLYLSTDAGTTWNTLNDAGLDYWLNASISPNGSCIVGYNNKTYVSSKNGGNTFSKREIAITSTTSFKPKFCPSGSAILQGDVTYSSVLKSSF
jgi:hypothetical protein